MLDFLGVTENWSAIENIPWTQRWTFSDDATRKPVSLDGVTFTGKIYIEGEPEPVELDIQKSSSAEEANILIVSCIGLPEGRHAYEIYSISESGNQNRLISGYIGVIKSIDKLVDELKTYASRTLSIRLPGNVTRQIRLEWLSCTLASASAQQAWEYYEQVKKKAEDMEETARKAEEAVEKLSHLDEKIGTLDQAVQDAQDAAAEAEQWAKDASRKGDSPYIGNNGNWWIGTGEEARDLNVRAEGRDGHDGHDGENGLDGKDGEPGKDGEDGEPGKSPVIRFFDGDVGNIHYSGHYWYVWGTDPTTGEINWQFTGILAEAKNGAPGKDGLNADSITRLYLESEENLPRPGNHGTVCYIPKIPAASAIGWLRLDNPPAADIGLAIGGIHVTAENENLTAIEWADLINEQQTLVQAEAEENNIITLTALEKGTAGNQITLSLGDNPSRETVSGSELTGGIDGIYTVYCWLLLPDGSADWLPVNQDLHDYSRYALADMSNLAAGADDYETEYPDGYLPRLSYLKKALAVTVGNMVKQIFTKATAQLLGLVKLGTGNTLTDGAPVGLNADGQMFVPSATAQTPGSAKISTSTTISKTTGSLVGFNADGQLMVPAAGYRSYGGVCFGTQYDITINNAPHVVTLPKCNGNATYNQYAGNMVNAMCLNLSQKGCLRYDKLGPNGENAGNTLYLYHDGTLAIDGNGHLTAIPWATSTLIDGDRRPANTAAVKTWVTSTFSISDPKPVNALAVHNKLTEYPTWPDLTRTLGDYVTSTILTQTLASYVTNTALTQTLGNYATTSWVSQNLGNYVTTSALNARNYINQETLNSAIAGRVECAGGIQKIAYMSEEQYANLPVKDASTLYLLY